MCFECAHRAAIKTIEVHPEHTFNLLRHGDDLGARDELTEVACIEGEGRAQRGLNGGQDVCAHVIWVAIDTQSEMETRMTIGSDLAMHERVAVLCERAAQLGEKREKLLPAVV